MKFIKAFIEWESIWRTATLQHCNTDAANGHIPRHTPVFPPTTDTPPDVITMSKIDLWARKSDFQ